MSKVAFLGLGAMGSRMATNLLRAGHELTVWNLTPEPRKTHFPVRLLEKDLGYAVQTGGGEASMPTVSAVRSIFRRAIDENLGNLNMTAVARLFSKER
jgi:3-hydroxyisobutyrate dehydrogenase-like beta-hydroxyacid dehydrogenase